MDVFEAIAERATVRRFKPDPIATDQLIKIIDAGRRAPSGYNHQGWQFVAVTDRDVLAQLGPVHDAIPQAPAAVAVVMEDTQYWREDAAAAIENMLLAAVALGYAGLWGQGCVMRHQAAAKAILGVPDDRHLIAIVPIGRPAQPTPQAAKKPLEDILSWNCYGRRQP